MKMTGKRQRKAQVTMNSQHQQPPGVKQQLQRCTVEHLKSDANGLTPDGDTSQLIIIMDAAD